MRNCWVTTHWPPEVGEQADYGIYLFEGNQKVGSDIRPGDRVWIYESKGGRKIVRKSADGSEYRRSRHKGKEGVIALAEIVTELRDIGDLPEKYDDGTERWWHWKADTRLINQSGFVPRQELNVILRYKRNNYLRGFGDQNSGLKRISEDVHQKILQVFNQNQPPATKPIKRDPRSYINKGHGKGGEGKIHKALKERIATNPSRVLGEDGLSLIQVEYPYPTGDRADLILKNAENQYIAVEVEVAVDLHDLSGVLQAIKYSRMYAIECRRKFEEVKAYLVAHQISDGVKDLCRQYDIETFVIDDKFEYGL